MKHGIVEGEATHLRYTPGWLVRALAAMAVEGSCGRAARRRGPRVTERQPTSEGLTRSDVGPGVRNRYFVKAVWSG